MGHCPKCVEDPSEACSDYCEMSHVQELPPLWDDNWPVCECCHRPMTLLRVLSEVAT
jgi:hypothetical protein